jgi:DNA-binding NarL/FixJ family response regulator
MKVLVVDDEPVARQRLLRLLGQLPDVEVMGEAANAREALASIGRARPDVVLLDVQMPGVDGLTLAALPDLPPSSSSPRTRLTRSRRSRWALTTTSSSPSISCA